MMELLNAIWEELNASVVNENDMFSTEDIEFANNYEIVLKHWDDGKLEAFNSKEELIEKYSHLLKENEDAN